MTTFIESPRFPDNVAFYAVGGRGFKTTVVETYGGDEYRTAAWAQARGEWDFTEALRSWNPNSTNNLAALYKFFNACMGQLYGFRFKDFRNFNATDNGATGTFVSLGGTQYQMYQTTAVSPNTYSQIIQKPVSATVVVTGGSGISVDYTTGIVTSTGAPTSWTGQFDIPCRFAGDMPRVGADSSAALIHWDQLKLIEIRNPS